MFLVRSFIIATIFSLTLCFAARAEDSAGIAVAAYPIPHKQQMCSLGNTWDEYYRIRHILVMPLEISNSVALPAPPVGQLRKNPVEDTAKEVFSTRPEVRIYYYGLPEQPPKDQDFLVLYFKLTVEAEKPKTLTSKNLGALSLVAKLVPSNKDMAAALSLNPINLPQRAYPFIVPDTLEATEARIKEGVHYLLDDIALNWKTLSESFEKQRERISQRLIPMYWKMA